MSTKLFATLDAVEVAILISSVLHGVTMLQVERSLLVEGV